MQIHKHAHTHTRIRAHLWCKNVGHDIGSVKTKVKKSDSKISKAITESEPLHQS